MLQKYADKQRRQRAIERQISRLEGRLEALHQISDRYSSLRLAIAVIGGLALVGSPFVGGSGLFVVVLIALVIVFGTAVAMHRRVNRTITRFAVWARIKGEHVARMALDWAHLPPPLPTVADPGHPFEIDLDLTGEHSLHRLIDTATTHEGGERLRDWLLTSQPDRARIDARQRLVRELAKLPIFRDRLILDTRLAARLALTGERWESGRLRDWIARHDLPGSGESLRRSVYFLAGLAAFNIAMFLLGSAGLIPQVWGVTTLIYFGALMFRLRDLGDLFSGALALEDALTQLRAALGYLETYRYRRDSALAKVCAPFTDPASRPTTYLRRIGRVVTAVGIRGNPILWFLLHALVPWDVYFAYLLSRYKAELAARLPIWLDAWFELEALCSLANFSYLNPEYTFAELCARATAPAFEGVQLGHPLIPHERRICNDFRLEMPGQVVIVTGSNMAGKSAFLRTLGVNLALTYAGGPAAAGRLTTWLFRLFACIRVSDSVTDGFSYFYAEVRRLKALLDELERDHPFPLFFMIDEIFRGTNNRERLIGSRAYIRALAGRNGVGVISTHDLELVRLADEMPQVTNMHFREEVIEGRMVFDYRLRPGPCPTTNALRIMELEGLPVTVF